MWKRQESYKWEGLPWHFMVFRGISGLHLLGTLGVQLVKNPPAMQEIWV